MVKGSCVVNVSVSVIDSVESHVCGQHTSHRTHYCLSTDRCVHPTRCYEGSYSRRALHRVDRLRSSTETHLSVHFLLGCVASSARCLRTPIVTVIGSNLSLLCDSYSDRLPVRPSYNGI